MRHGPGPQTHGARLRWIVPVVAVTVTVLDSGRRSRVRALLLQLVVFAAVGGVLNVLYGLLYVALREAFDAQWANALALVVSTIAGTWGHRRVTFGVRGSAGTVRHQVLGLALLAFGLAVTAGSLAVLQASVDAPSRLAEVLVLAAANLGVGLVRFAAFRVAMVPARLRRAGVTRAGEV